MIMDAVRSNTKLIGIPSLHTYTIVWLHGLGEPVEKYFKMFEKYPLLPNCRIVLPIAPVRSVTYHNGATFSCWYDFNNLENEYWPTVESSVKIVLQVLEEEKAFNKPLIIGGFSQGAALALYTGLSKYPDPLKAIISLSGFAFPTRISEEKKSTPVYISHGARDNIICSEKSNINIHKFLKGVNFTQKIHQNQGHSIRTTQWELVRLWLNEKVI